MAAYESTTTFYDPKGKYGCFSNYWAIPGGFVYRGKIYPTSEHAFQAAKFDYEGASQRSLEYAKIITQQNTPNKARILASQKNGGGYKWRTDLNTIISAYKDVPLRPNWDRERVCIMHDIVRAKISQSVFCQSELKSTGSSYIAEDSSDAFWGWGTDHKGQNFLGRILIAMRQII